MVVNKEGQNVSEERRFYIFANLFFNSILNTWSISVLSIVLPPIMKEYNINIETAQWLSTAYSLASAITLPLTAFFINRFSTKRLYCLSTLISIIGLSLCCLAPFFELIIAGRVIQSIGTSMVSAMSPVIIFNLYPPEKRGTYMGWYGLSNAITPTFSPFISGILCDWKGWRAVYLVCLIGFILAFLFALYTFVDVLPTSKRDKIDPLSVLLCAVAFGCLTYSSSKIGTLLKSKTILIPLTIGILSFLIFVLLQFQVESPFLNLRVLKEKPFALSVIGSCILNILVMSSTVIFALYCMVKEFTATRCSIIIFFGTGLMSIFFPVAGKLFDRYGIAVLMISGPLILMISSYAMSFMKLEYSHWFYTLINIPRMIGTALVLMPLLTWGLNSLPKDQTTHGIAINNAFKHVCGAIGSGVFGSLMGIITSLNSKSKGEKEAKIYAFNICYKILTGISALFLILGIIICFTKYTVKNVNKSLKKEKETKKE